MTVAILFDREDSLCFPAARAYSTAFALTPSAAEAARARGLPLTGPEVRFSAVGHARCVAAARRAVREFESDVATSGLPASIVVMARQSAWGHAALVHRLHLSLPPSPWIVRDSSGKWVEARDWEALHRAFLPRIWDSGLAHRIAASRPPLPGLFNWLTRLLALTAKRRPGPWIASSSHKLKNGLHETLANVANLAVFRPTEGNWADYRALFSSIRGTKSTESFRLPPLTLSDPKVEATLRALDRIGEAFSDPRVRSAWRAYAPYLARAVPVMLGMVRESLPVLQRLDAKSVISYEANSWMAASLMEAAGQASIKRVVFNHNSHPPSHSAIADSVLHTLLQQRTWNELTDVAAMWSPFSMAVLQTQAKTGGKGLIPVRLEYPANSNSTNKTRPLRVLHAGNYQNWTDFFPWVAETASEYLHALEDLAAAVEKMDGIELVVRVRTKLEVDANTVEHSLGHRRNVSVCGTDQDFLEQLAASDLLVAHFSTTVEQALQMGKPVLLWGSTDRYQQFPGRETPPEGGQMDRVYVVRRPDALPAMLAGIRDAMRATPDEGLPAAAYAFSASAPGVEQLASFLIHPTAPSRTTHP